MALLVLPPSDGYQPAQAYWCTAGRLRNPPSMHQTLQRPPAAARWEPHCAAKRNSPLDVRRGLTWTVVSKLLDTLQLGRSALVTQAPLVGCCKLFNEAVT